MGVRLEMGPLFMVMLERKIQNEKMTLRFMALGRDLLRHLAGSVTWSVDYAGPDLLDYCNMMWLPRLLPSVGEKGALFSMEVWG